MRSSLFAVAATVAAVSAQQVGLGQQCSSDSQCGAGIACYGTTAGTIKTCGSFNSPCTSDSQCATNTCQNGICSGFLASSLYRIASSTSATASASSSSGGGIQPAPSSTVVAAPGTLQLGADCANTQQCAGGAECFASNAWGIKQCGKFNAACTSNSQCATNSCNNGLCNGFLPESSSAASASSSTSSAGMASGSGIQPAPSSTVVAAPGTLQLGADCANTQQCAGGAECFASNAWGIKQCGKFNALCTSNSQCATNTCEGGICRGFLPEESYLAKVPSSTGSASSSSAASATGSTRASSAPTASTTGSARASSSGTVTSTAIVTASRNGTSTTSGTQTRTSSPAVFTGGVSKAGVEATFALAFAALAWAL